MKTLYKITMEKLNSHQSYYASVKSFCELGGAVTNLEGDGWKLESISRIGASVQTPSNTDIWRVGN